MTVDGKQITHAFYGTQPRLAYYVGCSKGGEQGLAEAQRYPDDYDGLIAGDPASNAVRNFLAGHLWMALATLKDPESYIPASKLPLLSKAVVDACDALDGVKDGVLDDPRQCKFDPATLICKADRIRRRVSQASKSRRSRRSGWRTKFKGRATLSRLRAGRESSPGSWDRYEAGTGPLTGRAFALADQFLKYAVFDDPDYDFRKFSYDRDFLPALAKLGPAIDATDPNLVPLEQHGSN